jgi:hypothetical protein
VAKKQGPGFSLKIPAGTTGRIWNKKRRALPEVSKKSKETGDKAG